MGGGSSAVVFLIRVAAVEALVGALVDAACPRIAWMAFAVGEESEGSAVSVAHEPEDEGVGTC